MNADKTNSKKNILLMCIVAVSVLVTSCGGGGGGGVTPAPNAPQTGTGGVDGYAYAAVGSAPAARAAEAAPPAGQMPLVGARVEAECGIYTHITNTNAEGYFKISNVAAGNCELRVSKSGYATRTYAVTVAAGVTARVAGAEGAKLSPAQSGEITVTTNVSGAEVTIDGVSTGLTIPETLSRVFTDISAGEHEVGVSKAGWAPAAAKNVNVTAGNNALAEFVMAPADATPPVANAGADAKWFAGNYFVHEGWNGETNVFTPHPIKYNLNGSGSHSTWGGAITYQWTQTAGPTVELSDPSSSNPEFTPDQTGLYTFMLVVSDGINTGQDYVNVEISRLEGKLAFMSNFKQRMAEEVYTMNADGTELRQLTDNNYLDGWPHWSPDGERIVFTTQPGGAETTHYVTMMNADGTGKVALPVEGISRDWSPDGNNILFTKKYNLTEQIYQSDTNGNNPVLLTTTPGNKLFSRYSQDGTKIIFENWVSYDGVVIGRMNRDGSDYRHLTSENRTSAYMSWTPEGRILYTDADCIGCTQTLKVMNADGTGAQTWPVAAGVSDPWNPVMTDDGRFIYFTQNDKIHVMYADGSAVLNLGIWGTNIDYHPGP